ncbi:Ankyrin repeat-containing domain [Phytophthora cactorum]|nr:Ankyrin repeat-containing domain [Phytophthora cactorum]
MTEAIVATDTTRRPHSGGHGAAREPDEPVVTSSRRIRRSPVVVDDNSSVTSHSSYHIAQSPTDRPIWLEMKRRHQANMEELHGKLADVPRHWLFIRFLNNSFFARRLMRSGMLLSAALAGGVIFYSAFVETWLDDHKDSDEYDDCHSLATFSNLIYQTLPAAIILSLPGSGLRAFEPFKRNALNARKAKSKSDDASDNDATLEEEPASGSVATIRRCFVFQLCEVLAVFMLFFDIGLVVYFLYVLFIGALNSCSSVATQIFTIGAAFCYFGLFTVLYYFARYREHIKMQLGAFMENDQTGDLRKYVDLRSDKKLDTDKKMLDVIRTRLYHATRRGDVHELREILEYAKERGLMKGESGFPRTFYATPKIRWKFFARSTENPVHIAAGLGNIRALEILEENGFDLTVLDKVQRVVISTGGFFWHFIQVIVKRPEGSDAESADSIFHTNLYTPLHCAVATGQLAAVRWLLERGVPPGTLAHSSFRSNRVPPLFLAEHAEIARELLVHGADPLVIPDPGFMNTMTPLQLAYVRGNYAVAQELEEWGSDVALTPFHLAAAHNDVAAWVLRGGRCLAGRGADPNFQDVRGRSPLHWAAKLNKLEVVRSLLRANADPNLADGEFMTPLMCAASALDASRELVSELTAAGGDIGYQLPTTGDTALHVAVREENEASALAVLASGGDLMLMNNEGLRPLDCTASTRLLFELKQAAGQRDVMISYTHSHLAFARKLRQSLEEANVTTWLDLMDPSGIGEDYASSEWCLKELALAKQVGTPILAVSTEGAIVDENLQVYLYTRQIVPFEPAIVGLRRDEGRTEYDYDESRYRSQFHLLLDGVRDEVEKHRYVTKQKNLSRVGYVASVSSSNPNDWQEQQFVFFSHGDKHSAFVRQLSSQLSQAGIPCYSDPNVSGRDFYTRIQVAQETILRCSCFVVLVSRQTVGNELVRDQLAFAEDKGRPIFPVVLNDVDPGLDKRYTLVRSELFHFMANGMGFKPSSNKLISELRRYCNVIQPAGSVTGSETEETRNLDSIDGLEDNEVDLSNKYIPFVETLAAQLVEAGVACYSDRNVSGQDFNTRIQIAQETILRCSCFVVLVSRQTMGNELVRDQLAFAEDKSRPIFPIVLNDLNPGLDKRYSLVRSELFHFMANGMGFQASFDRLVGKLREQCDGDQHDGSYASMTGDQTRNLDSIKGLDFSSTYSRMYETFLMIDTQKHISFI